MDHARMLAVLANLADGIDPASGTAFPTDSPYQHPETVRALFLALRRLEGAGSAASSTAAGSAGSSTAAGSAGVSNSAAPAATAEAAPAGRKPAANSGAANKGGNAGKAWTAEEDQRLAAAFDAGEEIGGLTKAHGRSRLALEIRLAKLGRLPMPENTLYGRKPQTQEPPQTTPSAGEQTGRTRSTAARPVGAPRRASEAGGLRYHVPRSVAATDLRA